MIRIERLIGLAAAGALLCACATAPIKPPEKVELKPNALSAKYSSFNATVLSQAGAVTQSFTTSLDPARESFTRLETGYTFRLQEGAEQLRVGDAVSNGLWGGGALRYAGMQFGTRLGARADVVAAPELATRGLAVLPTVSDALFASIGADPAWKGQSVSVSRSLGAAGANGWGLKVKGADGRAAAVNAPLIARTRLLQRPGCADYVVDAGKVRLDYALTSNEYGPTYAGASIACGAPFGLTVEGHGQYLEDEVAAVGVGVARQFGALGAASAAFASSYADGDAGWLARFGFDHQGKLISLAWRTRIQSPEFREAGALVREDPIMKRDLASIGLKVFEDANLSLAYATQTTWSLERSNLIALQQRMPLGRGSLSMSAGHSLEQDVGSSVYLSYKRPFGFTRRVRSSIEEFEPLLD